MSNKSVQVKFVGDSRVFEVLEQSTHFIKAQAGTDIVLRNKNQIVNVWG